VTEFRNRTLDRAAAMTAAEWDSIANPSNEALPHPFTRHAFLTALEESGSATARKGWRPAHLVLQRENKAVGLLPLYEKTHSYGEYVFDHAWADAFTRAGGRYYPKLQASIPFTPVTGPRFLIADGEERDAVSMALMNAAVAEVAARRASSLHITFLPEAQARLAARCGWLVRNDQQFHWENRGYDSFDSFLSDLSSAKRKNLRKERACIREAGVTFDWLSGANLTEAAWDDFFVAYTKTGNTKWNPPYLTREFFSRIGKSMGEQILLVVAKLNGRAIAGALNLFDGTTLYGRNWGATAYVPFLHFEACYYQAIDFAIARGLKKVEAGAQGGHKLLRGYLPQATWSAHYIANPAFREAIADYLERERPAVMEHIAELADLAPFRKA
jgi:predicted N-acyltransferase